MMKTTKCNIIVFEGTEGVGKTTQAAQLAEALQERGYKVLQTKEPGTHLSPLTMTLRGIMLDNKYTGEITPVAREYVSQAIRSIHLERVIVPAMSEYDFIVQDRGILSGLAYGAACGHDIDFLLNLINSVIPTHLRDYSPTVATSTFKNLYSLVINMRGNVASNLERAVACKKEFETGDAMEAKGLSFMQKVEANFVEQGKRFNACDVVVDGKTIQDVHRDIVNELMSRGLLNG